MDRVAGSGEIHLVDDDAVWREAVADLLRRDGHRVTEFADGHAFAAAARRRAPDCIILDLHIPGRSGLDILRDLAAKSCTAAIFVTARPGDMQMAVDAIKRGALDVFEKPFDLDVLASRARAAIRERRPGEDGLHFRGADLLTARERDVLTHIADGARSKEIGRRLGISPRTVEVHRARIREKLGVSSVAELMRIVLTGRNDA